MVFLDRLERRFGWLAFPGFLRYYALFHVMVYGVQLLRPGVEEALQFDRAKILEGEVWRVVTFLFSSSGFTGTNLLTVLFLFFMVMIAFMMSDALENAWGVFRTSMFHYCGALGLIAAHFIYPLQVPGSGFFLYQSAFFAFATLFPHVEFRLFLILPVQVRFLAIILGVLTLLPVLAMPVLLPFYLLSFANYLLWAGIPALKGRAKTKDAVKRRKTFHAAKAPQGDSFHRCEICGKTEVSDPGMDFRIGEDGREYCEEHVGNS